MTQLDKILEKLYRKAQTNSKWVNDNLYPVDIHEAKINIRNWAVSKLGKEKKNWSVPRRGSASYTQGVENGGVFGWNAHRDFAGKNIRKAK